MCSQWPFLWILYIPTRFRSSLKWQSPMFTGSAPSDSPDSPQTKHDKYTSPLKTASMKNISKKTLIKTWRSITQSEFDMAGRLEQAHGDAKWGHWRAAADVVAIPCRGISLRSRD